MASTDAFALSRSDLNGFLFADIGEEASGMTLSVISALARVGVDPWQEAGRLAMLPRIVAADALARIIAGTPASRWSVPDATAVATRLVTLLPPRTGISAAPAAAKATSWIDWRWAAALASLAIFLVGMLLNLAGQ